MLKNAPPGGTNRLKPADLARKVVDLLSDRQAEDILLLDIRNVASFADYFVVANALSRRQIDAILEAVDDEMSAAGVTIMGREGKSDSGWVLIDLGDVVVHIFDPEERAFYNLEEMWHAATQVVRLQ